MTGFEPAASCSQSRRATNCATPGYLVVISGWAYSPKPGALPTGPHPDIKLKKNARCGQICGQGNCTTVLPNFQRKQSGGFAKIKGSKQHFGKSNRFGVPAPKAPALPTGLYPDNFFIINDIRRKSKGKISGQEESKISGQEESGVVRHHWM